MKHGIFKVLSFEPVGLYTLKVHFDDGVSRTIDFLPVLAGPMFGSLLDHDLFSRVTVDPEVHTLVWPNGIDFDPETLHEWPDNVKAFSAMTHSSGNGTLRCAEDHSEYQ